VAGCAVLTGGSIGPVAGCAVLVDWAVLADCALLADWAVLAGCPMFTGGSIGPAAWCVGAVAGGAARSAATPAAGTGSEAGLAISAGWA
jgi:hypothetical protein